MSETAESSCPKSACLCRPKEEADAAESAERKYPTSNLKLTSPRLIVFCWWAELRCFLRCPCDGSGLLRRFKRRGRSLIRRLSINHSGASWNS
ncbi:hypothetical protein ATANTOWER_017928 [Ataeniobius toweri]|uniref:Uncharacterized protein n=1 Tax=Ataeniobius toweri TaxID=208326 RepID=A0ABU7A8E7_9TELE|nr:hypothetical protein [Ataeniobius toweri]